MKEMKEDALELMDEEFEDKQTKQTIRRGFIRKVYGIIFFQLLTTTIIIYIAMTNELIMNIMYFCCFTFNNFNMWSYDRNSSS